MAEKIETLVRCPKCKRDKHIYSAPDNKGIFYRCNAFGCHYEWRIDKEVR